ncbi:hypothetical protein [Nocardia seriolae]|nr:hypothetical protein [Nocardia seriolae]
MTIVRVIVQASTVEAMAASQAATAMRGAVPSTLSLRSSRGARTATAKP